MNGVLGMAQLLLMPNLSDGDRKNYARVILTSGQTLLTLLNDILDLSKIEAGKIQIETAPFDPAELLAETRALYSEAARGKGLELECRWLGAPGQRYCSDPHRLRQMLFNLVGNAVKFTVSGEVRIEAAELERDGEAAVLEFSVSDTGIGIPVDKLELLFRPFSQADNSTTREFGGTGLGLSIVRTLAKLMGGETGVSSTPGQGSRFWFRIRAGLLAAGENSRQADRPPAAAAPSAATPAAPDASVLVVEDDPVNRQIIKALLGKLGLRVLLANDGQQAVEAIVAGPAPDIVLMDIQMPVMDGYSATALIRSREADGKLPRLTIIALTANAFAEDRERCLAAGMDDFLSKPIVFDNLAAMLGKWLHPQELVTLTGGPVDVRALARCVGELAPLLAQNKFDAIARFEDVRAVGAGTAIAAEIADIERELRLFHFAVVLERLQSLLARQEALT
jgi:CheY-like chemotaxis protein